MTPPPQISIAREIEATALRTQFFSVTTVVAKGGEINGPATSPFLSQDPQWGIIFRIKRCHIRGNHEGWRGGGIRSRSRSRRGTFSLHVAP